MTSPARFAALPWAGPALPLAAVAAAALGLAVALAVGLGSPALGVALFLGVPAAFAILRHPSLALYALVVLAYILPFAIMPVRLGVQPTLLDALLVLGFGAWLARVAVRREPVRLGAAGRLLLALILVMLLAHLLSTPYAGGADIARKVIKLFASMLVFVLALNLVRDRATLVRLVRVMVLAAALEAVVGIWLYLLPRELVVRLLSSLRVVGYPSGGNVLRFLPGENDTYTDILRATSTSVDPNVLGGVLMLAAAIAGAQLFAARPILPRPVLAAAGAAMVACMLMTHSRSSWVGLAVALLALGSLRYRAVWLAAVPLGALVTLSPLGRALWNRVLSGFAGQDKAAGMRLDEYRNALEIVQQHPLLGIGFGAPPTIDLAPGVSSIYLTVAETAGLPALALYLAMLMLLLARGGLARPGPARRPDDGLTASLQTALVAGLVAGLFDHYFASAVFFHMVALFWLICALLWRSSELAEDGAAASGPATSTRSEHVRPSHPRFLGKRSVLRQAQDERITVGSGRTGWPYQRITAPPEPVEGRSS